MKAAAIWIGRQIGNLLTGIDNKTLDPARVGMLVAIATIFGTVVFYLAKGVKVELREIAEAFAIATVAGGGSAALTHSSQPKPGDDGEGK